MADELGPLPRVHPRSIIVASARADLGIALTAWQERHDLTASELLWLLAGETERILQQCVQTERREAAETEGNSGD